LNFTLLPISNPSTVETTIQGLVMQRLLAASLAAAVLTFTISGGPALAADGDPTPHQIYQAAEAGHLDQAQQMMNQVLRDNPTSGTAHYVQAELYAREGNYALARSELNRAEQLEPGLPHQKPQAVQELKSQLGIGGPIGPRAAQGGRPFGFAAAPAQAHFPWATMLVLALVVAVFWMLFRRRNTYVQYPGGMPAGGAPGAYGPGGYMGPGPMGGGGIGSGIAGSLASGLAVGAGVVAGEELAHHFLDGGQHPGGVLPPANENGDWQSTNNDMGGRDFGVNDPGSWDGGSGDAGSGGGDFGGGGDDWT
jgi:uncharacterized protein